MTFQGLFYFSEINYFRSFPSPSELYAIIKLWPFIIVRKEMSTTVRMIIGLMMCFFFFVSAQAQPVGVICRDDKCVRYDNSGGQVAAKPVVPPAPITSTPPVNRARANCVPPSCIVRWPSLPRVWLTCLRAPGCSDKSVVAHSIESKKQ